MFACQECGKKFATTKAAERASMNSCPKCGGCDIDLVSPEAFRSHMNKVRSDELVADRKYRESCRE